MTRPCVRIATALCLLCWSAPSFAQQWVFGGQAGVGTGLEAGDPGDGQTHMRPARYRVHAGLDAYIDESPGLVYSFIGFAEVHPHLGLGGEARLLHGFSPHIKGFIGASSVLVPHTLAGGGFGLQFHQPLGSPESSFFIEPSFWAMPLGTDLPGDKAIIWGLITVGIHADAL